MSILHVIISITEELSQRANDAALKADNAEQAAIGAQNRVQDILNKLPQDKIKIEELANSVTKTEKYAMDVDEQSMYINHQVDSVVEWSKLCTCRS